MRVIFMGNPDFAIPSLKAIVKSRHTVIAVVSNPPKEMGRGKKLSITSVSDFAINNSLLLIQPDSLKADGFIKQINDLTPDVLVVVAFRILPQSLLQIPKQGAINLHASLLPAYRGAAPIQWALFNGDRETGLSTFFLKSKVDTGNIILQETVLIEETDDYGSLSERMSYIGAKLVLDTLDRINSGNLCSVVQDQAESTLAPKITKEMCAINWDDSAEKIRNRIRGLSPFPGAYTSFAGNRIKIFRVDLENIPDSDLLPGTVISRTTSECVVQTGNGTLALQLLQRAGKRPMNIREFLSGSAIREGDRLGN